MSRRVIVKARGERLSRTGSQWALVLGSGWRAVCPSWRDSNCPGSDKTPGLRAPPSISIQLARRPPTEPRAGPEPRPLIMGTIVPAWYSPQLLGVLCPSHFSGDARVSVSLAYATGKDARLRTGDPLKSVSTQERGHEGLTALHFASCYPRQTGGGGATLPQAPTCLANPATRPSFPNQDPSAAAAVSRIFQQRWGLIKILPPLTI